MQKPYIAVAPMMDWTDRHCRYFMRLLAPDIHLYTEMVTTGALLHGDRDRFLRFDPSEQPLALQLGGADPKDLAQCARMAENYGYDEVNLNVGCPSDRVQRGKMGACLMKEPELVAESVAAMQATVNIPVTVKTRIGVDDHDSYEALHHFMTQITQAGCEQVILHARKAWLKGLSPKENRTVPPLRYEVVEAVKRDFPACFIVINGEVSTPEQVETLHNTLDGVMIGREAYHNPYLLAQLQQKFFTPDNALPDREGVILRMLPYLDTQLSQGVPLKSMTRHLLGLFAAQPGAKQWRRYLSEHAHLPQAAIEVLHQALEKVAEPHKL